MTRSVAQLSSLFEKDVPFVEKNGWLRAVNDGSVSDFLNGWHDNGINREESFWIFIGDLTLGHDRCEWKIGLLYFSVGSRVFRVSSEKHRRKCQVAFAVEFDGLF